MRHRIISCKKKKKKLGFKLNKRGEFPDSDVTSVAGELFTRKGRLPRLSDILLDFLKIFFLITNDILERNDIRNRQVRIK